jgi:catechol 2,3-dioxygenase-like lactoylglutathione lyase family enzyme
VDYIGMTVSDIDKSSKLYAKATDLQSVNKSKFDSHPIIDTLTGRDGVFASTHLMKSVNAQLRLMQFKNPSEAAKASSFLPVYGPGIAHVCYQVAKKTRTYETFLENGASHIGDPEMVHLNPKNPVYYAYAHDHDKILFEVEHVDVEALKLPEPPKNDYRIRHVSLATSDMDRMVEFYSTLLETQNPRRAGTLINLSGEKLDKISGEPGSKIEMAWFQVRNIELEIIQYHNPKATALKTPRPFDALGYNSIVFDVADMQAAKTLLLKAGGTIVSEQQPMDGGQILFGRDLDGNLLGFQVISSESPLSSQNFTGNGV